MKTMMQHGDAEDEGEEEDARAGVAEVEQEVEGGEEEEGEGGEEEEAEQEVEGAVAEV
jgi:hypothetical protein